FSGRFEASITDTIFSGNWCGGNGGGLSAETSGDGNVTLIRTSFYNNTVAYRADVPSPPGSYRGGGFYSSSAAAASGGVFTLLEDCFFEGNRAAAQGGALCVDGGSLSATGCDFSDNSAGRGGALGASGSYFDDPVATSVAVRGGQLRDNAARFYSYTSPENSGGAVFAQGGAEIALYDVPVVGNSAGFGGAVSLETDAHGSAWGVNFSGNAAEVGGGAVHVWGNGSRFVAEGCAFLGNAAGGYAVSASS
ncbi:unnamed protein product, partial [Hapterophycus canaliculatus]